MPVTGFNLYMQTAEKDPSNASTAIATNNTTFIAPGETVSVPFEFRPSLARSYYMYVTDANRQVIAHVPVTVVDAEPSFTFHGLGATLSTDTVMAGGTVYRKLNNNNLDVYADISNSADATPGQPTVKFVLEQWVPETGELKSYKTKSLSATSFASGERKTIEHTFLRVNAGYYLRLRVDAEECAVATADTLIYIFVGEKTLSIDTVADGVATLSGAWDAATFSTLATDPSVTAYDLRGVSGVSSPLKAANPNALFYVNAPVVGNTNVVFDDHCDDLVLTSGYDFRPLAPFRAGKVQYTPDFVPGTLYTLILPFACQRPTDYLCRYVTEVGKSYVTEASTVTSLEAAVPYLVQTGKTVPAPFKATNAAISVMPDTAVTMPFIGTFAAMRPHTLKPRDGGHLLALDTDPTVSTQYFNVQDTTYTAQPFTFVLVSTSKKVRATVNETFEKAYRKLAATIVDAQTLYLAHRATVRDSVNVRMRSLLADARAKWLAMELESAEINSLIKELESFCATYPLMVGYVTEPVDFTSLINNPSFETNNKNGWKSDSHSIVRSITNTSTFVARGDGSYFLHNNSQGRSTKISQTVTGLLTGWYRVTVMTGTEEGGTVNVFAAEDTVSVAASELGKYYLTEAVIDSVWVDNGELTIGVGAGDSWYKCDNFRLFFLGDPAIQTSVRTPSVQPAPYPANESAVPARKGLYDLMGRPVASPDDMVPGVIYIYNGKKVMRTE